MLVRYRGEQLHLAGNTPTRDATFSVFDPHGDVSVYEFFMCYEEWSVHQIPPGLIDGEL